MRDNKLNIIQNKGITLVALVITVIIMLVLARCNNKYSSTAMME